MKSEDEVEFDSICFHEQCVRQGEQLFSENNYTQALTHAIHKELCRALNPESFQKLYKVPHKIASRLMRRFETSLNQEIEKR
jgi:hypothetical protein